MQTDTLVEKSTKSVLKNQILLDERINNVCQKVAPFWTLENFVAVNPYMGDADKKFASVAQELAYIADINSTMPTDFYLNKIKTNDIATLDLEKALQFHTSNEIHNANDFLNSINTSSNSNQSKLGTVIEITSHLNHKDWQRFATHKMSVWFASYFDQGKTPLAYLQKKESLFTSWKKEALIDKSTEIAGLKGFKKNVKNIPNEPLHAIEYSLSILGLKDKAASFYLQRVLMNLNGWSGYAAKIDYEAQLENKKTNTVLELLAVLTSWELCVYLSLQSDALEQAWNKIVFNFENIDEDNIFNPKVHQNIILQEALNFSIQRKLISKFNSPQPSNYQEIIPKEVQAVFCIDVRSEVFRRNLEQTNTKIQTYGFAGFFGFPVNFFSLGQNQSKSQSPVLLKPSLKIFEKLKKNNGVKSYLNQLRLKEDIKNIWKTFKSGAVSCFVFVSPLGLLYIPKLILETFKMETDIDKFNFFNKSKKSKGRTVSLKSENQNGISIETQIEMAKNALTGMSLTENFGKLVLFVGHGSSTKNNPYGSALHCGACGGHTGEANAKIAAQVLNNSKVRKGLGEFNIHIPDDTTFLACLHNTTTDEITIFNEDEINPKNTMVMDSLKKNLSDAIESTRAERALRMLETSTKNIAQRSKDWSQIRPEWGLAGCNAFLVGKSERTNNQNLKGEVFLHTYDADKDKDNNILQAIMTAPMVVTSWISLQYYASTVDNKKFGSGNKTLHNITAGIGVIEGFSGDLRTGLPWQSVSDGHKLQHTPTILNVIIEASTEALNDVIKRNKTVQNLVDNGWLKLLQMNNEGLISNRYIGNLKWEAI